MGRGRDGGRALARPAPAMRDMCAAMLDTASVPRASPPPSSSTSSASVTPPPMRRPPWAPAQGPSQAGHRLHPWRRRLMQEGC